MLPVVIYEKNRKVREDILTALNEYSEKNGRNFSLLDSTDSLKEADSFVAAEDGILLLIVGIDSGADPALQCVTLEQRASTQNRDSYALYWLHSLRDLPALTMKCLHPVGFVLPPPDNTHVESILQRVFDDYETLTGGDTEEGFISLQTGGAAYRLAASSIDYIEALDKKLNIWTGRKCLTVYGKMGDMEVMLGERFFRCHRSYLINYERLESADFTGMEVTLRGNIRLPLARSGKDALKARMKKGGQKG